MNSAQVSPRLRDAEKSKADILVAAQCVFSEKGYAQAGLREIATRVGVTPTLVLRYFDDKKNLYAEALSAALDLNVLLTGTPETFGRDAVTYINQRVPGGVSAMSMLLMATADADARDVATRLLREQMLKVFSRWFGKSDAELRATLITAVLGGIWIYRDFLPLPHLTGKLKSRVANWLEATLQNVATGPLK